MQGTDLLMLKAIPCVFVGLGGVSKCMLAFSDNNALFHQEVQNCLVHEGKPITAAEMCITDKEVGRHWKLLFPGALCNTCGFF